MIVPKTYAWCFSHGRMHTFRPSREYQDGAWCTALWVPLAGNDEAAALADKTQRYGTGKFIDQLPLDKQMAIYERQECSDA